MNYPALALFRSKWLLPTYPLQRTVRVLSALSPGRVLLVRIPLDQYPSLHLLRHR